jgi:hypothetical protein
VPKRSDASFTAGRVASRKGVNQAVNAYGIVGNCNAQATHILAEVAAHVKSKWQAFLILL